MFFRILRKSLVKRKGKVLIAIIAVIMGASIPSAMLNVSMDINEKIGAEFRKFGANLLIVPESDTIDVGIGEISLSSVTHQRYINESDIYKIKTINWSKNVLGYAPFLYQLVNVKAKGEEQQVVLTGTWFEKNTTLEGGEIFSTGVRRINSWWWGVEGEWIADVDEIHSHHIQCMIGKTVAEKMNLNLGDIISIQYENKSAIDLEVAGIITTGGNEDNHIFTSLAVAQNLTDLKDKIHTVQVSALCIGCPIETIANEIEAEISYIEAKTILQMTNAEMGVLSKIETMMIVVTVIALLATMLGVSATLTTSVLERRTEIGLMKSIGADNRKVALLFISEALIIGVLGGVFGFLLGVIGAQIVGIIVFNSLVTPQITVLPIILLISCGISLLASLIPVRRAMQIQPVIILRG